MCVPPNSTNGKIEATIKLQIFDCGNKIRTIQKGIMAIFNHKYIVSIVK